MNHNESQTMTHSGVTDQPKGSEVKEDKKT